jgi:hypothetical protein
LEDVCNPEKSDHRTASVPHWEATEKKIQYQKHSYAFVRQSSDLTKIINYDNFNHINPLCVSI